MQREIADALGDGRPRPRQEARAHSEGFGAEPQVEARRLDLVRIERAGSADGARGSELRDRLGGQDA